VTASIPGLLATGQASRPVTVTVPAITVGAVIIGSGLQDNTSFTVGAPQHGGVTVTLTSSNPEILLSPNATTAGQNQITIAVPNGTQSVGFYVQGLEGHTGGASTSDVTVSAPGFTTGTGVQTIVQPALDLQGVPTTMAAGAADVGIYARLGTPATGNGSLNQIQGVRAGGPGALAVSFTSNNAGAASLLTAVAPGGATQSANAAVGVSNTPTSIATGGVGLHNAGAGSSSISVSAPGYITTTTGTRSVTTQ
jgi:hypothetical protein